MNQKGLTLIELMVAVTVSAVLALGAVQLFQTVTKGKETIERQQFMLDQLRRGVAKLESDLFQIAISRSVQDEYGNFEPGVYKDFENWLDLTKNGWKQSIVQDSPRADLQRVSYDLARMDEEICEKTIEPLDKARNVEIEGFCLVRSVQFHLDQDSSIDKKEIGLLGYLDKAEVRFLFDGEDVENQWVDQWPPENINGITELKVLEFKFEHQRFGEVLRRFEVPSSFESLRQKTGNNS